MGRGFQACKPRGRKSYVAQVITALRSAAYAVLRLPSTDPQNWPLSATRMAGKSGAARGAIAPGGPLWACLALFHGKQSAWRDGRLGRFDLGDDLAQPTCPEPQPGIGQAERVLGVGPGHGGGIGGDQCDDLAGERVDSVAP